MPFVQRDENNKIIALFAEQQAQAIEELSNDNLEVIDFIKVLPVKEHQADDQNQLLVQSDADFIRVLEDLITVLLDKHILLLTDLPPAAQEKLLKRQKIRSNYTGLMQDDEGIF